MSDTRTILCVDDDADVLNGIKVMMESKGYRVCTAGNAREAMDLFASEQPDAVVVDLMMEEVDTGAELARRIRDKNAEIPLYMLSSTGDSLSAAADPASVGVDGVLQKPLNPDRLDQLLKARFAS